MSGEVTPAVPAQPPPRVKAPRSSKLREELLKEKEMLEAALAPHRDVYERMVNDPALAEAKRQIRAISSKLAEVQDELAAIARPTAKASLQAEPGILTTKV